MSNNDEDILAVESEINLLNMVYNTHINRFTNIEYTEYIGRYKLNIPQYKLGIAELLVNRTSHKTIGLYGKIKKFKSMDKIIGIKLDLAKNRIIIDIIDNYGTVLKSIDTDYNINKYCEITSTYVMIDSNTFLV